MDEWNQYRIVAKGPSYPNLGKWKSGFQSHRQGKTQIPPQRIYWPTSTLHQKRIWSVRGGLERHIKIKELN